MVQKIQLRVIEKLLCRFFVEGAQFTARAVQPGYRPADSPGEGDNVFRAAQALRRFSIPQRQQQPALLYGFNAAFVVALFARLIAGSEFNRGRLAQHLLGARPIGRGEILAKLIERQGQQNAERQLELNAAFGKKQIAARRHRRDSVDQRGNRIFLPPQKVENPFAALSFIFERAVPRESDGHRGWQLNRGFHYACPCRNRLRQRNSTLAQVYWQPAGFCLPAGKINAIHPRPEAVAWPSSKGQEGRRYRAGRFCRSWRWRSVFHRARRPPG